MKKFERSKQNKYGHYAFKCHNTNLKFPNLFKNKVDCTPEDIKTQWLKVLEEFYEMKAEPQGSIEHRMETLDLIITLIHYYHLSCMRDADYNESWNAIVAKFNKRLDDSNYNWGVDFT